MSHPGGRVRVYKDEGGEWRWTRLESSDTVADSGEGYVDKSYAVARGHEEAQAHDAELIIEDEDRPAD